MSLGHEETPILLVGNKLDLDGQREVGTEEIQELALSLGMHFFETSAKDNTNIDKSMEYLVDLIAQKLAEK